VARRPFAALALAVLIALGGCGGNDTHAPEQVVREFVNATRAGDADKLCDEILSPEFIARATGAKRGETAECKRQLGTGKGLGLSLAKIERAKVNGDHATVTAVLRLQGQPQRRVFQLEKQDGDWKLAGGSPG
jgi:ketosteroid isomerase-like protein